jgi:hypothetical protein
MKTELRKSLWLEDWYVIEPHHGTGQPEGTDEDWKAILEAMKKRESESFRRVGVKFDGEGNAMFCSPRNSMDDDEAVIPAAEVDSWIAYAEGVLRMNAKSAGDPEAQ